MTKLIIISRTKIGASKNWGPKWKIAQNVGTKKEFSPNLKSNNVHIL